MSPHPETGSTALAGLLEAQATLFGELAELVVQQRRALLAAEEDHLLDLAGKAENLATRFRLLETERGRLEADSKTEDGPEMKRARHRFQEAFGRLLRETAVSGTVLERLGDTVAARQALVGSLFAMTYLPNGRPARVAAGSSALCMEG